MVAATPRSPRFRPPRTIRKMLAAQLVVALLIGVAGVMAPLPHLVTERAMATETRRPLGEGAAARPATLPRVPAQDPGTTVTTETTDTTSPTSEQPTTSTAPEATTSTTTSTTSTTVAEDEPAPDERVAVAEDTRDFNMIGVTLPETPAAPVFVRTAAADTGPWSEWRPVVFEDDEALPPAGGGPAPEEPEEGNPGAHSEPVWVGDATRYELNLTEEALEAAQVHLVYETTRQVAVAETAPAGVDPTRPTIYPRSSWGARAPKVAPTTASSFQFAVVHHSAGVNGYSAAQVPALLRSIQAYHMDANGWNDIGYNFAVDGYGRIWEARAGGIDRAIVGGHAQGFNTGSTGVVVLGNFESAGPTGASVNAVGGLLAWKFGVHRVDPRTAVTYRTSTGSPKFPPGSTVRMNRIVGHRDVGSTACPGRYLYAQLGAIRSRAAAGYPAYVATGIPMAGNFVGSAAEDVYVRQPGLLNDRLIAGGGGGFTAVRQFGTTGTAAFTPFAGDFDRNGYDDIFWYARGVGVEYLWRSRGDGTFLSVRAPAAGSGFVPFPGDFDGDGDDDIFWYSPNSGRDFIWLATSGGAFRSMVTNSAGAGFRPVPGDYDGDGDDDIVWYTPNSGRDFVWGSRGNGLFVGATVPAVNRSFRTTADDFDRDGDDDILWYSPGSAGDYLWRANARRFTSSATPAAGGSFRPVSGDFDADGGGDVYWYTSPGQDWMWWYAGRAFGRSAAANLDVP